MEKRSIDICGPQETRIRSDVPEAELFLPGGFSFLSVPADDTGNYGVGALVSKELMNVFVKTKVVVPHRSFLTFFKSFVVLVVYAPTAPRQAERESFFESVSAALVDIPSLLPLIGLGDWNASLLSSNPRGISLFASMQFEDFISANDLISAQSATSSAIATFGKRAIDHVVVPKRFKGGVLHLSTLQPPVASDHRAIVCLFKVRWRVKRSKVEKRKLSLDQVAYDKCARDTLDASFQRIWASQSSCDYESFCVCAQTAAAELKLPEIGDETAAAPWRSSEYKRFAAELEGDVSASMSPAALELAVRNALDSAERATATSMVESFATTLSTSWWRAWEAWKFIFATKRTPPRLSAEVVDTVAFREHFRQLLQPPECPGELVLTPRDPLSFDSGAITLDEVREAASDIGLHRASGIDGMVNELFKCRSIQAALVSVFNKWLTRRRIDGGAAHVLLVPLFKKGDRSLPANYRGISLQSAVVKLLMRVFLRRISVVMDKELLAAQAGFRAGRSTVQNVMTVNSLVHLAKSRRGYNLQLLFYRFLQGIRQCVSKKASRSFAVVGSSRKSPRRHFWLLGRRALVSTD